jgi:hypothetical protein
MKNGVFWVVTPCGSVRRLLVAACVVPSPPIFVTLMEAPGSSETSVLTRATRRNNLEDTILQIKYKLYLVGLQEVKWEGGGTESTGHIYFYT